MLPKLADDANAAKAVGGDRCYLSSPDASSQIVPSNKAIHLIDECINFTATLMLQLRKYLLCFKKERKRRSDASQDEGLFICVVYFSLSQFRLAGQV